MDLFDLDNVKLSRLIANSAFGNLSISPDGRYLATATRYPDVNLTPRLAPEVPLAKGSAGLPSHPATRSRDQDLRVADGSSAPCPGRSACPSAPTAAGSPGPGTRTSWCGTRRPARSCGRFTGPADPVLKVQFAAGGRQVVGFTRRQATVWDADTGRTIATVDGLSGPAFITPDGRRIVGPTSGGIKWWDVQLGREVLFLPMPDGHASCGLALSADGRRVATSSGNKLILWEAGPP